MKNRLLKLSPCLLYLLLPACAERFGFNLTNANSAEIKVVTRSPFQGTAQVGGVNDLTDSVFPNLTKKTSPNLKELISHCTKDRVAAERARVIALAKADPTLVPFRYSFSMGSKFDDIAKNAFDRSILRVDSDMETPVFVAPLNGLSQGYYNSSKTLYYVVDHKVARQEFIDGISCFYSVGKVKRTVQGQGGLKDANGNYLHAKTIMYFGADYSATDVAIADAAPRLFHDLDNQPDQREIVKLYLADLRSPLFNDENGNPVKLLDADFDSSAVRNKEYEITFADALDLRTLWNYRDSFIKTLSSNRVLLQGSGTVVPPGSTASGPTYNYSAYEAVPRLMDYFTFSGASETVLPVQYTPVVFDLGDPLILTSSLNWGTFFNVAALHIKDVAGEDAYKLSHLTSWVGGKYNWADEANGDSTGLWKLQAEDGFPVIPDANGNVYSSRQMFSPYTVVPGHDASVPFQNGFEAMAAFANIDCSVPPAPNNLTSRIIGPWHPAYQQIKIWIDIDRNGHSTPNEIKSLADAGVDAINPCFVISADDKDAFGNGTAFRSTFLHRDPVKEPIQPSQQEIIARMLTGQRTDGLPIDMRVAIDLQFVANTDLILEKVDRSKIIH